MEFSLKSLVGGVDKLMDVASGPLDPLAKLLPGPIGDMAKVVTGVATGNPLLVANGAVGIGKSALQSCGPETEHVPSKQAGQCPAGYAPEVAPRKRSEREAQLQHLQELERYFDAQPFGKFKEKDLVRILNDPKAPRSLQEAAGYLLAHPEFRRMIDTAGEGGKADGTLSLKDLRAMIAKTRAQLMFEPKERCQPSAPGSTPPATPTSSPGPSPGAQSSSSGTPAKPASTQGTAGGVPIRYEPGSHLDPNYPAYVEALHVLDQNWLTFDSAAGVRDQYIRREDLKAILGNPNASKTLKDAARFLLEHPEYFNRLEMAAGVGGKDGIIGWGDVKAGLNTARQDLATYGVRPPPGGSKATTGTPAPATATTGPSAAKDATAYDDILNDTSLSIDERIMLMLERAYSGIGTELEALTKEFTAAQKGETTARSAEDIQLQIQRLTEKRNRMFALMTTLSQKSHELAKQALQNMGRA